MGGKHERVIEREEGKKVKRTNAVFMLLRNRETGKKCMQQSINYVMLSKYVKRLEENSF